MTGRPHRGSAPLSPARARALDVLIHARQNGSFVRDVMSGGSMPPCDDRRDEALAFRLALGATSARGCLDDALNVHIDRPRDVSPALRDALRISAFEIIYLGTSPEVAVSQGVELARKVARRATGLANAVLRRVAAERDAFLSAEDAAPNHRDAVSRARRAGLPVWLVRDIESSLGDRARSLLESQQHPAPVYIHVSKSREERLDRALTARCSSDLALPGSRLVDSVRPLIDDGAFARGDVVSSDYAAQVIAASAICPGSVLEVGAGRGTKTFVRASIAERLGVEMHQVAVDLFGWKCEANVARMVTAGLPAPAVLAVDGRDLVDALASSSLMPLGGFDSVLLDAPCSGTGTMRRHLEIPWRLQPSEVRRELPELQLSLLAAAARAVAVGGSLVYATCSVLAPENVDVVDAFLASDAGAPFELRPVSGAPCFQIEGLGALRSEVSQYEDERGRFQTVPARDGFDGHFCARMVRMR